MEVHMRSLTGIMPIVLLAGLVAGSNIMAQTRAGDPVRISLNASGEFTDNRDSTPDGECNFDFYIRPRLDLVPVLDTSSLVFFYAPSLRYRSEPSMYQNETELYHDLGLELRNIGATRTELRLLEYFNYTDDPAVTEGGTTLRRDSSYILNRVEAGVMRDLADKMSRLDLAVRHYVKAYDEATAANESDESSAGVEASALRQFTPNSSILGTVSYANTGYKEIEGAQRGYASILGGLGLEVQKGKDFRLSARLGLQSIAYADSSVGSESAPAANVAVFGQTVPSFRYVLSVDHRIRETDAYPFSSQKATDFKGEIEWDAVPQKWTWRVGALYHTGKYDADTVASGIPSSSFIEQTSGTEEVIALDGGFTYTVDEFSAVTAAQRCENRDSEVNQDFTRNTTSVSYSRKF